jgi:hypothetical protein
MQVGKSSVRFHMKLVSSLQSQMPVHGFRNAVSLPFAVLSLCLLALVLIPGDWACCVAVYVWEVFL